MVGYRNLLAAMARMGADFIRHSDGGVSERHQLARRRPARLYQAFRWWGIGTVIVTLLATRSTLSGIPMVGYRNRSQGHVEVSGDFIRHSDGGVSERRSDPHEGCRGLYQAFRWWGIGTAERVLWGDEGTLSGIPMVGYRNIPASRQIRSFDFIRHSDGGVSEHRTGWPSGRERLYQAFRWWGIGTLLSCSMQIWSTLSGIPMVGYRNGRRVHHEPLPDFIRHSDGGVSELGGRYTRKRVRLYQAFRWWGIGTAKGAGKDDARTLSGIPMVGYRNIDALDAHTAGDFIRHSDGGVSEQVLSAVRGHFRLYQAFRWWGIGTTAER